MSHPGSGMTAAGVAVMLLAVSAGVGSDEYGAFLGFVGVLVGANLVAIGVRMADGPTTPIGDAVFASVTALRTFLRRNLAVVGLAMASSAVTAVAGEAAPVLCFSMFALLLLGLLLIVVGVLGD